MVGLAVAIEKLVLKHLVGQEPIILFMATIGLAWFLEGLGRCDVGRRCPGSGRWPAAGDFRNGRDGDQQLVRLWLFVDRLDIWAAVIAAALVAALVGFSQYAKQGGRCARWLTTIRRRCRWASACNSSWIMVWSIAGFVALVAGIMWGTKSGVQFSLSLIALKALPVLMLGGFTSIPGAVSTG